MSDYCFTCEDEVARCWSADSGCSGGGHCWSCGGYNFKEDLPEEELERQVEMSKANKTLNKVLENEQNSN
jgi:hypothetical protein